MRECKSKAFLTTPVGFAVGVLGLKLYGWQERVLVDLDAPGSVALRAANNSGKTSVCAAGAALWNASVFPGSLTICTAGVYRQVSEQLFTAINRHAAKFPGGTFNATDTTLPNGSKIFGFATDSPERFEGWHDERLLIICDESKAIPNGIFESVSRCAPTRFLLMSSPGGCSGYFFDAFNSKRKFFRCHHVTAFDCPHISQTWVDEQIAKYGNSHPLIRSMIHGEFMSGGDDGAVIPLSFVERCLANPPAFVDDGTAAAFCDFAAGGDENCLAIRRGNRVEIAATWREQDTMRACGRFIQLFRQHNLQPSQISGDEGGLGQVMCDSLAENGWPLQRVNNGSPATKPEAFANFAAETWYEARTQIERAEIILPNDTELIAQLTSRRGWPDSKGRLRLEPKEDLRSRGLPSPDRADAVLGSLRPERSGPFATVIRRVATEREWTLAAMPRLHNGGFDWPQDHPFRPHGANRYSLL